MDNKWKWILGGAGVLIGLGLLAFVIFVFVILPIVGPYHPDHLPQVSEAVIQAGLEKMRENGENAAIMGLIDDELRLRTEDYQYVYVIVRDDGKNSFSVQVFDISDKMVYPEPVVQFSEFKQAERQGGPWIFVSRVEGLRGGLGEYELRVVQTTESESTTYYSKSISVVVE